MELILNHFHSELFPLIKIVNLDSKEFDYYAPFLFYTRILKKDENGAIVEEEELKYPCAPFYTTLFPSRYFVISSRHGPHKCLDKGDLINVYNSKHQPFEVKVVFFDDDRDFIIFESPVKLCFPMPIPGSIKGGCRYVMLVGFEVF